MYVENKLRSLTPPHAVYVALICLLLAPLVADAEDHYWSSHNGGSFNYWLNWVPNYVPGEDDNAVFELGLDPAYEVTFYEGVTNLRCIFRTDKVVMDLGSFTYTLTNPGYGFIVGDDYGDVSDVLLYHGVLDTTVTHVGLWEGSDGLLNLESGLTMNVSDHLTVGNDGDGILNINDGASVVAEYVNIGGHDLGNRGTINLEGSTAELIVNEMLTVGQEGYGTLNLMNGCTAAAQHLSAGAYESAWGEISVTQDSVLDVGESLSLGLSGFGGLTVEDAGQVYAPDIIRVGWFETGSADMYVSGEYAGVHADNYLSVGDNGYGTMVVEDGADVEAGTLVIGWGATGDGTLTLTDPNTVMTLTGDMWVGSGSYAMCGIYDGPQVSTNYLCVGAVDNADGQLDVMGEDTILTVHNDLDIGREALGDMFVMDNAQVDVATTMRVGRSTGGYGWLELSSDAYMIAERCDIGEAGEGTLVVDTGADLELEYLLAGTADIGVGHITVEGEGTNIDMTYYAFIGNSGYGEMALSDHASMTAETLIVGKDAAAQGELTVSDASVSVINNIQVGQWGAGTFNITSGADVRTTEPGGWIKFGDAPGADATVLVSASSLTAEQAPIVVGQGGSADLTITNGAEVWSSGELFMAMGENSVGHVTVDGQSSQYISASVYPVRIGNAGEGILTVQNGGYFEKNVGGVILGDEITGDGTINVNGEGAAFKAERLTVGEYGAARFNVNGGHAGLGVEDLGAIPAGELHVAGWGRLIGTGTVVGDVVNVSGAVRPGGEEASALTGALTIDGDYTQETATLEIRIKGASQGDEYSSLNVTGTAELDGVLYIQPVDDYFPPAGEEYIVLTSGTVAGSFPQVRGPGWYEVEYNSDSVVVTVLMSPGDFDGDGDVDISDLAFLLAYYGTPSGADYPHGDIDGDGDVDLSDLATLLGYYGRHS